jgi:hypothetical protein
MQNMDELKGRRKIMSVANCESPRTRNGGIFRKSEGSEGMHKAKKLETSSNLESYWLKESNHPATWHGARLAKK